MGSVSADFSEVEKLRRELEKLSKRAIPYAAKNGVNTLAFNGRKEWIEQIKSTMVLRNRWIVGSIRVVPAKAMPDLNAIQATVGSVSLELAVQEKGAPRQLKGRRAIPTSAAAGQPGARPRTRRVRAANLLRAIKLLPRTDVPDRRQRNAIAIKEAREQGSRFVYLELASGAKGLFRLTRRGVTMLWDFSHGSPPVPRNPTLERMVEVMQARAPRILGDALEAQIVRALSR